jgi:hypothetical protein
MANYTMKLTPTFRHEGTEGGLDTSVVNGVSAQRTGYIEVYNSGKRKIVSKVDGTVFNDTMALWNDANQPGLDS